MAPFEKACDITERIQQEETRRIFYIKPIHPVYLKMCKEIEFCAGAAFMGQGVGDDQMSHLKVRD